MFICCQAVNKVFEGKTMKDAYLSACKWLSSNIISINNSEHIMYRFEKQKSKDYVSRIKLIVYVYADEEEVNEHNCDVCREAQGAFFLKENKYQCYSCKIEPYRKRMKQKIELLMDGLKGVLMQL